MVVGAFFLGRDDAGFQLRYVVNPSVISDPKTMAYLVAVSDAIDKKALGRESAVMHMCDGELHSIKRKAFDPDASAAWTDLRTP